MSTENLTQSSSSATSPSFKQVKRANSGPWLQKPLEATLAEIDQSNHTTISNTHNTNNVIGPSSNHSNVSYGVSTTYSGNDEHGEKSITNSRNNNENDDLQLLQLTPSSQSQSYQQSNIIARHLTLFDLVSIGVGGTIGSGIFVLCGYIANHFAGPATCISWTIAGAAACLSGICYAELACRMPAAGSSYVYVYASMGELPAVLVAACLSLEYGISASAVARSWGDKCIQWINMDLGIDVQFLDGNFNPLATIVAVASVGLLMGGVKESKSVGFKLNFWICCCCSCSYSSNSQPIL